MAKEIDDPGSTVAALSMKNSCVLITGGTGSFGTAMAMRLLSSEVKEVRVFSRDEAKQDDMRRRFSDERLRFYLGDVRNQDSVARASEGVDYVFHAAALKQVPSCEFFPLEAVRTNVLGTQNVLEAAHQAEVKAAVCLGTDKAVYPINAMGHTKALMEKVVQAFSRNHRTSNLRVSSVRYGNVMGSRGSVIPLFIDQITSGKAITLTDPSMTRFMMSLDEAVQLVEHAFLTARSGDLFIQLAPAATVGTVGDVLIDLFASSFGSVLIGTRHGEKKYETLATKEELARAERDDAYLRIPVDARDLNYGLFFDEGDKTLPDHEDFHSHNARLMPAEEVKERLLTLSVVRQALNEHQGPKYGN